MRKIRQLLWPIVKWEFKTRIERGNNALFGYPLLIELEVGDAQTKYITEGHSSFVKHMLSKLTDIHKIFTDSEYRDQLNSERLIEWEKSRNEEELKQYFPEQFK